MTLKLKRTPGLYLVGFMASGKTTLGRALAEELGWPFADIDSDIESRTGKTIAQIFSELGESGFRELETQVIQRHVNRIESGYPCVVALGGGAFIQPRNWELIENNGITVWLDCPMDVIRRRLGDDITRPLASDRSGLAKLFADRRPLYARADYKIEIDTDEISELIRRIRELPIF